MTELSDDERLAVMDAVAAAREINSSAVTVFQYGVNAFSDQVDASIAGQRWRAEQEQRLVTLCCRLLVALRQQIADLHVPDPARHFVVAVDSHIEDMLTALQLELGDQEGTAAALASRAESSTMVTAAREELLSRYGI